MSDRPSYLVIIPMQGVFSAHYLKSAAFEMADRLIAVGAGSSEDEGVPYVVEVPEIEGIPSQWKVECSMENVG